MMGSYEGWGWEGGCRFAEKQLPKFAYSLRVNFNALPSWGTIFGIKYVLYYCLKIQNIINCVL